MDVSFLDAVDRHLTDARLLDRHRRYANADHLYGITAECVLKGIMVGLGAPVSRRGDLTAAAHRVHIDALWDEYCAFVGGAGGASYLPFPPLRRPFEQWGIDQRYAPQRHFTAERLRALHRREEVDAMLRCLQDAMLDGIIATRAE